MPRFKAWKEVINDSSSHFHLKDFKILPKQKITHILKKNRQPSKCLSCAKQCTGLALR